MQPGELIADRFEIRREAGAGGMSVVYQARDRLTGQFVALKVLETGQRDPARRFNREAQVLAELRHPGIVGFVDHGSTATGKRYLAMEWLDGEDLGERLARSGLSIAECVKLARRVADALAFAHARGIIHRDIKPGNLFLPDGDIERVKLLDFGIARMADPDHAVTRTGVRVGTPSYMSPEQARGLSELDARVDVFALGSVLFQCLSGRKPFSADDPMALIAKILLAEPPPLRELRPEVPPELDRLVAHMMAKDPDARLADGAAVVAALDGLGSLGGAAHVEGPRASPELTARERRLLCVAVVRGVRSSVNVDAVQEKVLGFGGRFERLADKSLVATFGGAGVATDLVAQAARCALQIRALLPDVALAIATGRGHLEADRVPFGEAIDRAARLLRLGQFDEVTRAISEEPAPVEERPATSIRIDDVTAGLLGAQFDVGGDAAGLELRAEHEQLEGTRTLLGKATPCVGRDAELAAMEALFAAACSESEPRCVLVTAPAGVGKSRLRYELVKRLRERGAPFELLMGRGDPISAGAPFGLLGGAIRRSTGLRDGEPLGIRQRKLRARLERHLADAEAPRIVEFLGELTGTPFPDEDRVQLKAARADALLLGDQMRRAFEDWLAAECAAQPVLLVLEDLHWGDLPTVNFVASALRTLADRPLMVLALARPEVHELFPRVWEDRGVQEIRLFELTKKGSEKLVRKVLGDQADARLVERLVDRAAGNVFYLEELIRAASEGREELPETVVAMMQARLEGMEPEARRLLRAASVFGQVFWKGAVHALLGGEQRTAEVTDWLHTLERRELITLRGASKFRGETEYVFRHAIVRDAAYGMLTDNDRRLGHRLAAGWLLSVGEAEPMVLAEHLERGGEPERAIEWYRRAAEQALGGNDFAQAIARAERGAICGAAGESLGTLRLLQAEARNWRAENAEAEKAALEAMRWLTPGSAPWYQSLAEAATASGQLGHQAQLVGLSQALLDVANAEPIASEMIALTRLAEQTLYCGKIDQAAALYRRIDGASRFPDRPATAGRIYAALSSYALFKGDLGNFLAVITRAVDYFGEAGDLRSACWKMGERGYACLELGDAAQAQRVLRGVLAQAERMGLSTIAATARQNLGLALGRLGKLDEAAAVEKQAAQLFAAQRNRRMTDASRYYLALVHLAAGRLDEAESEARAAVDDAGAEPRLLPILAEGSAILAQVLLARARPAEAFEAARTAMELLEQMGGIDGGEAIIRLSWAETLAATGDLAQARAALETARTRLKAIAEKIGDPALRRQFLEQVPDNARTFALVL
jgi:tetratricopeptide (TPR) repeat protein